MRVGCRLPESRPVAPVLWCVKCVRLPRAHDVSPLMCLDMTRSENGGVCTFARAAFYRPICAVLDRFFCAQQRSVLSGCLARLLGHVRANLSGLQSFCIACMATVRSLWPITYRLSLRCLLLSTLLSPTAMQVIVHPDIVHVDSLHQSEIDETEEKIHATLNSRVKVDHTDVMHELHPDVHDQFLKGSGAGFGYVNLLAKCIIAGGLALLIVYRILRVNQHRRLSEHSIGEGFRGGKPVAKRD
eukprot:892609-Prymnesium_polylepis.2